MLCSDLWELAICLPAVLSDLSGLIAFNHFFPFTPRFHFPFDSHICSSIVLSFHPSLFPINCSVFAFVYLFVSHFLLLQTEMEEDPQNKENKVKQGTASDSLIPRTANYPPHRNCAVYRVSTSWKHSAWCNFYPNYTVAWKWVRLVTERVSCLIFSSLGVVSLHKIMNTVVFL